MLKAISFPFKLLFGNFPLGLVSLIIFSLAFISVLFIMAGMALGGQLNNFTGIVLGLIFFLMIIYPLGYLITNINMILNNEKKSFTIGSFIFISSKYALITYLPTIIVLMSATYVRSAIFGFCVVLGSLILFPVITVNYSKSFKIKDCFNFTNVSVKMYDYFKFITLSILFEILLWITLWVTIFVIEKITLGKGFECFLVYVNIIIFFELLIMGLWIEVIKDKK